ncbi:flagellar basal body-associated protein FliL [Sphingomonas sp. LaA6.9]|uniref:flagellar basal body-associated FliL family protein n=1 Tax=Sphingomonas sp. LaA6.9 TaxID=2919914 RepID=UPI001F4FFE74|nr:flagellar basal body-associated FliL family protein [Sphingomonas sp. LaA6.9]MCJ8156354.1 flagellar basal body-associated FliL family protein [Sphingomonas sp. LaA6.9]
MSKDAADTAPRKKGGMKKIIVIALGAIALVGGGAGGAIYASQAGLIGGAKAEDSYADKPKLVMRADGGPEATYFEIEKNFTSNLADADGFMQLSLGVATYYDSRVLDNIKRHEVPIRSAVLMTLADQSVDVIATPAGKKQLQKALKDTVNRVLQEKEGFGGVDDVYFTSFVIQ